MAVDITPTPSNGHAVVYGHDWSGVQRVATRLPAHDDHGERIILGILTLFKELKALDSLHPNPINGALFNQLFDLVTTTKTTAVQETQILGDPRLQSILPELRHIWGEAEYLLELEFARKIISAAQAGPTPKLPRQMFDSFPYLDQYYQLARMEANTLDTALGEQGLAPPKRVAFLGSGPTPFTALCMRRWLGLEVELVNVDRSTEAVQHGTAVARALAEGDKFRHVQADAADLPADLLAGCDIVHFAALIGADEADKLALILAVARVMRPGALMMLRSTSSLRQCLYPPVDVDSQALLEVVTPVVATRYFGRSTSLTTIVVSVDPRKE